jgi:hypothetical protein
MHTVLSTLPEIVHRILDILELLIVRLTLLGVATLGAYAVIHGRSHH